MENGNQSDYFKLSDSGNVQEHDLFLIADDCHLCHGDIVHVVVVLVDVFLRDLAEAENRRRRRQGDVKDRGYGGDGGIGSSGSGSSGGAVRVVGGRAPAGGAPFRGSRVVPVAARSGMAAAAAATGRGRRRSRRFVVAGTAVLLAHRVPVHAPAPGYLDVTVTVVRATGDAPERRVADAHARATDAHQRAQLPLDGRTAALPDHDGAAAGITPLGARAHGPAAPGALRAAFGAQLARRVVVHARQSAHPSVGRHGQAARVHAQEQAPALARDAPAHLAHVAHADELDSVVHLPATGSRQVSERLAVAVRCLRGAGPDRFGQLFLADGAEVDKRSGGDR